MIEGKKLNSCWELSADMLDAFIASQYAKRISEKAHFVDLLWNET